MTMEENRPVSGGINRGTDHLKYPHFRFDSFLERIANRSVLVGIFYYLHLDITASSFQNIHDSIVTQFYQKNLKNLKNHADLFLKEGRRKLENYASILPMLLDIYLMRYVIQEIIDIQRMAATKQEISDSACFTCSQERRIILFREYDGIQFDCSRNIGNFIFLVVLRILLFS